MGKPLKGSINDILNFAYPNEWNTSWLSLPLEISEGKLPYNFHVICSDTPSNRNKHWWPPSSKNPHIWLRWEPSPSTGFWIRPRKYDPLLRDRLILLESKEIIKSRRQSIISQQSLLDACNFATISGRMVWHNPPKGGASSTKAAHFQSFPLYWQENSQSHFTFPCCYYNAELDLWTSVNKVKVKILEKGMEINKYPVLGLVVWGPISGVVSYVWKVICDYDKALACNLVIQPSGDITTTHIIRVFVFPRRRKSMHFVNEHLLEEDEKMLMNNNRGGKRGKWSFAGVEMSMLTQVEWGGLFEDMCSNPRKWGKTLLKLLKRLTLSEHDRDWIDFVNISNLSIKAKGTDEGE